MIFSVTSMVRLMGSCSIGQSVSKQQPQMARQQHVSLGTLPDLMSNIMFCLPTHRTHVSNQLSSIRKHLMITMLRSNPLEAKKEGKRCKPHNHTNYNIK